MNRSIDWQVYIIECSDQSLYTGIACDIDQRFIKHASGAGAKYFRGRQPNSLIYFETGHTRSSASKREIAIKKMKRMQKLELISSDCNQLKTR